MAIFNSKLLVYQRVTLLIFGLQLQPRVYKQTACNTHVKSNLWPPWSEWLLRRVGFSLVLSDYAQGGGCARICLCISVRRLGHKSLPKIACNCDRLMRQLARIVFKKHGFEELEKRKIGWTQWPSDHPQQRQHPDPRTQVEILREIWSSGPTFGAKVHRTCDPEVSPRNSYGSN